VKRAANFLLFQGAWFLCVASAGRDSQWPALAAAVGLLAVNAAWCAEDARREAWTILVVAPLGFALDTLFARSGVLAYRGIAPFPGAAPLWILVLWAWFAATFHGSLGWLKGRPLLAAVLGLVGAPLSYAGGARLGAVSFGEPAWRSALVVGSAWALATPAFLWLAARPRFARAPA
jgi:hypothetical protein